MYEKRKDYLVDKALEHEDAQRSAFANVKPLTDGQKMKGFALANPGATVSDYAKSLKDKTVFQGEF